MLLIYDSILFGNNKETPRGGLAVDLQSLKEIESEKLRLVARYIHASPVRSFRVHF